MVLIRFCPKLTGFKDRYSEGSWAEENSSYHGTLGSREEREGARIGDMPSLGHAPGPSSNQAHLLPALSAAERTLAESANEYRTPKIQSPS